VFCVVSGILHNESTCALRSRVADDLSLVAAQCNLSHRFRRENIGKRGRKVHCVSDFILRDCNVHLEDGATRQQSLRRLCGGGGDAQGSGIIAWCQQQCRWQFLFRFQLVATEAAGPQLCTCCWRQGTILPPVTTAVPCSSGSRMMPADLAVIAAERRDTKQLTTGIALQSLEAAPCKDSETVVETANRIPRQGLQSKSVVVCGPW
jgi:hypothetical protein